MESRGRDLHMCVTTVSVGNRNVIRIDLAAEDA